MADFVTEFETRHTDAFAETGLVHAGVLLALTIPIRMRIRAAYFLTFARQALDRFEQSGGTADDIMSSPERQSVLHGLEQACEGVQTPLGRLEHELHAWVAFIIMPVFALANAGIPLKAGFGDAIGSGVGLGIALGLLIGKPVGVVAASWLAIKLGLGDLPAGSSWKQVLGAGCLAGVGFTMSLFIANLAFPPDQAGDGMLQLAKVGILCGSLVSGVAGFLLLRVASKPEM